MRVKTISYRVVWDDDGERREDYVKCDETKHADGERQFLRNGRVEFAVAADKLISYRRRRLQYHSPASVSEWIEVAKMHYRQWRGRDPLPST